VTWRAGGRRLPFGQDQIGFETRDPQARLRDAPVIFAGHGVRMPERGIDQLAGADVRGAVVIILHSGPEVEGFPSLAERVRSVAEAGAGAVISVPGPELRWSYVARAYQRPIPRLASQVVPPVLGSMSLEALQALTAAAGVELERLLNDQPGSSFRAVTLALRADIEATTALRRYSTNNVVGRIRGSGTSGQAIMYLGHWDHFGICRPEGEADRICNGAIDNASGIAAMIEIAGRFGRQPRPARDILFLATTVEELGLLGAEHFARRPTVPLASIVAAMNLDTVAIHPAGEPVAVIGRGTPALDAQIDAAVTAMGRRLDTDDEAAAFLQRQDGWALNRNGVPAVMVGGSFSNMSYLQAFLNGAYHGPSDNPGPGLMLDGAAEDANLMVALGRRLADPAVYQGPGTPAR
jgi:proteasome lid subunit RPN8/RPN11